MTRGVWAVAVVTLCALSQIQPAQAQKLLMNDGRVLAGKVNQTPSVAETADKAAPEPGGIASRPILIVDDDLRRTYVSTKRIVDILSDAPEQLVRIQPWQDQVQGGGRLASVGPAINITPWDKYGRRVYEMVSVNGPLSIVQGISEITPRYARVEALRGPPRAIAWDMRLATTSIPSRELAQILATAVQQDDLQQRLQIVRFYSQGERYNEATRELKRIIEDFPDQGQELEAELPILRRYAAVRVLSEIQLRKAAGQHRLARELLDRYPTEEVDGETLQRVRELATSYETDAARIRRIGAEIKRVVGEISDPDERAIAAPVAEEVVQSLTYNNIERLVPFVQLLDDPDLSAGEKAALAISGWILGPEEAKPDLRVAIEVVKVRDGVQRYLREPKGAERAQILSSIISFDAAKVDALAKIVARMVPPWHDPKYLDEKLAGDFVIGAPGLTADGDFRYHVQLPPEYDPTRRYPLIVALNGQYNDPTDELEFWAGGRSESAEGPAPPRTGHAMRYGYVTMAVQWQKPHQLAYEFSGREHVAVLTCVRDAMRRFSVDSDRIYLAGHDLGGDAAWDMGAAHPDVWAGVVPIVATAGETYIRHYWQNAEYLPYYFVCGELDGLRMSDNAPVLDKCLQKRFDFTVVEYLGRGHEPFHDEVLRLFDWMGRKSRAPAPQEFECATLRPWDNCFWWIECEDLPADMMVFPSEWESRRPRAVSILGKRLPNGTVHAKVPSRRATMWLNPDVVDFSKPTRVEVNGHRVTEAATAVSPAPEVLLEDVRTRADRQRPYWAKIEWPERE